MISQHQIPPRVRTPVGYQPREAGAVTEATPAQPRTQRQRVLDALTTLGEPADRKRVAELAGESVETTSAVLSALATDGAVIKLDRGHKAALWGLPGLPAQAGAADADVQSAAEQLADHCARRDAVADDGDDAPADAGERSVSGAAPARIACCPDDGGHEQRAEVIRRELEAMRRRLSHPIADAPLKVAALRILAGLHGEEVAALLYEIAGDIEQVAP